MAIQEVRASGLGYLALATELLQRARLAEAEAGVWEAADLRWWWRTPRRSDVIDHIFWVDAYQRCGLARAMLTAGLDRLAKRGSRRLKVGYATDVARGLYVGAGFRVTSTTGSYNWRRPESC